MGGFQWVSMLSAWQWGLLALVPPAIVALYFLKLRRTPLEVPSTYLWRKALEDLHVNSLWQRLRRSILLLLQILLVLLAMLALLNPSWRGTQLTGERFIFLVDNSASMSATDVKPSRLDEAKRIVGEMIEQLPSEAAAMIVSFSDSARVVQPFTTSRRELRRRLAEIEPTTHGTSLTEALRVSSGLANPGQSTFEDDTFQVADALPATLYIVSDGRFPPVTDFSLGNLEPNLITVGEQKVANIAVAAFSTRPLEGRDDAWQAYARLQNNGPEAVDVSVELLRDGNLIDADTVKIDAGGATGVDFDLGPVEPCVFELRASVDDRLVLDNVAWAPVNPPQPVRVLLATPGNEALQAALRTEAMAKLAEVTVVDPAAVAKPDFATTTAAGMSLVIFDRCAPATMPACNTLFIGALPPGDAWKADAPVDVPVVIDTEQAHPLMHLVELGNVLFAEGTPLHPPQGATILIESQAGVLAAIAPRDSHEDAVLGFTLGNTNWPLRLSFPVFVLNMIEYLGGKHDAMVAGTVRPGEPAILLAVADELVVRSPSGKKSPLKRDNLNTFQFTDTDELGVYEVEAGGQPIGRFAVNLFNAPESNLAVAEGNNARIGYVEVKGRKAVEAARRPAWRWLATAALAVLLIEWYIYNRRVFV